MDINHVVNLIIPYLQKYNIVVEDKKYLKKILSVGIDRDYNLKDIAKGLVYYFDETIDYQNDDYKKFDPLRDLQILEKVINDLSEASFEEEALNNLFKSFCEKNNLKFKDFGPIIRFGLTGKLKAPAINEICSILGKSRTLERLNRFKSFMAD